MNKPIDLPNIRNITVSGRIASGASTLARHLADQLGWGFLDGGKLFRLFTKEHNLNIIQSTKRPDEFDLEYEEKIKKILRENTHQIIQSHLAGFDAQGIGGVFKVLVVCEDSDGEDKIEIRIDRLVNRDGKTVDVAKNEILEREKQNLAKWRRLYAHSDPNWVYWDKKYYDFSVNSYSNNDEESVKTVLTTLGFKK